MQSPNKLIWNVLLPCICVKHWICSLCDYYASFMASTNCSSRFMHIMQLVKWHRLYLSTKKKIEITIILNYILLLLLFVLSWLLLLCVCAYFVLYLFLSTNFDVALQRWTRPATVCVLLWVFVSLYYRHHLNTYAKTKLNLHFLRCFSSIRCFVATFICCLSIILHTNM